MVPGGAPSPQSKDRAGKGTWNLLESPLLCSLPPSRARSNVGMLQSITELARRLSRTHG